MEQIRSITFAVNDTKPGAVAVATHLAELVSSLGVKAHITKDYPLSSDALMEQDLCCAIGGDGTLLGVLNAAIESNSAVLGINLGKLGFLSTFNQNEAVHALPNLIEGKYIIAERAVLSCRNVEGEHILGLNDVVIKETQGSSLIRLSVSADGQQVSEYYCDGLIFSTPTGSTAYNLSAGGPIVMPKAKAIAMTPICPHTLGNRSVIFADSTHICIESASSNAPPRVTVDGRTQFDQKNNFPLEITITEKTLRLMQNLDHSHFSIVRDKLGWGGSIIH